MPTCCRAAAMASSARPRAAFTSARPGGLDDWCYIFASRGNEEHWRRLVHAIGREDLLADPNMSDGPTRAKNQAAVDAAITAMDFQT